MGVLKAESTGLGGVCNVCILARRVGVLFFFELRLGLILIRIT